MPYVDGFVAAVPTAHKEAFRRHAQMAAEAFMEHGALAVVECWGHEVPEGELNSFHTAVLRRTDETIIFSWITWPSKAVRDAGMAKVMADPRVQPATNPMPFDAQGVIHGGVETVVETLGQG